MRKNGLRYLKRNERAALTEFIACLQNKHAGQIDQVILFGSKARGDFDAESDLDVLVLADSDDWHLRDQVVTLSTPISVKHNTLISPKTIGPVLYQKMRRFRSPLLTNIRKEGSILWTKQPARRSSKTSQIVMTN